MEESQNFGHEHPLVLLNEEDSIYNGSEEIECWRCEEKVSAPTFGCSKSCGFYLHESCAEAPSGINHPFHRDHTLILLQNPPSYYGGNCICDFCDKKCKKFIYHCSCDLDLHIKCAFFTLNIAENNLKELENVAFEDPSISTANDAEEIKDIGKCFGCWEPLSSYAYFSPNCGFSMHKRCAELPFKMNHMCHSQHSLFLQFNVERLACKICHKTQERGFVYCCSLCKFVVHIECVSLSPIVEDRSHQHQYTLVLRLPQFICDACGANGCYAAYICSECNIIVHKECISLPRIIRSIWHLEHRVLYKHLIQEDHPKNRDCLICHNEVDTQCGNYYCADCDVILHVYCATKHKNWYDIVSKENEDNSLALLSDINPITVIETNDAGEATKVKHFLHKHNLMLGTGDIVEDYKCCDGCTLSISALFYYCSECDFSLHKECAELPKKKNFWIHEGDCRNPVFLIRYCIFNCTNCEYMSNGFAYKCNNCKEHYCLRCVALTPGVVRCSKHEHPLLCYLEYEGLCSCCGLKMDKVPAFCCKDCNLAIFWLCLLKPVKARHKCNEHILTLAYHDDNDYSESHYCDICEEKRDPNYWFYHCERCDTCAHIYCVLGKYPFIKVGNTYNSKNHPHPLIFVKKIHYYPNCMKCCKPCQDLSLECTMSGCNYIVHWKCRKPVDLRG